jgi:hypothetical protein
MSFVSLISPAEAALPTFQVVAANALNVVRPLLGIGALAAFLVVFKPLLVGLLRAALLAVKPRQTLEARSERHMLESVMMLNSMARDLDGMHPGLASELRSIASRGNGNY